MDELRQRSFPETTVGAICEMTINHLRRLLYKFNRFLGDVNAVKRGRIVKRSENRIIGRLAGKVLRRLWR